MVHCSRDAHGRVQLYTANYCPIVLHFGCFRHNQRLWGGYLKVPFTDILFKLVVGGLSTSNETYKTCIQMGAN